MNEFSFLELLTKRQSDRAFTDQPIDNEVLLSIVEAARLSPSACNAQPWSFVLVTDKKLIHGLSSAMSNKLLPLNHFTKTASAYLVLVEESPNFTSKAGGFIKRKHFPLIDIGIAANNICLQAASLGVGSCMIGWFSETKIKRLLSIPDSKRVPLLIALGYPAKPIREKKRKPLAEILYINAYGSVSDKPHSAD